MKYHIWNTNESRNIQKTYLMKFQYCTLRQVGLTYICSFENGINRIIHYMYYRPWINLEWLTFYEQKNMVGHIQKSFTSVFPNVFSSLFKS